MKKKLATLLLVGACAFGVVGFVCCDSVTKTTNSNNSSLSEQNGLETIFSIETAYAKAQELGYEGSLEDFIASLSGKDGKDGVGIHSMTVNGEGELVIVFSNDTTLNLGKVIGKDGVNGIDGKDGVDGVGIFSVYFNEENELVIEYTDGTKSIVGKIPGCAHNYGNWTEGKEPTCTSIGYEYRTCTLCENIEYKFEEKLGHSLSDFILENDEYTHKQYCMTCGEAIFSVHTYDDSGNCNICDNYYSSGLRFELSDDGTYYRVSQGTVTDTKIIIPSMYKGLPVKSIASSGFAGCKNVTNVIIPDSVTCIEWGAFPNCSSLKSIIIPDSVIEIGELAFYNCSSLTSVTIPDSVTRIGKNAFKDCNQAIVEENGVQYIGDWVVGCDTSIIVAELRDETRGLASEVFSSCRSLTSVTIPDSVTWIGANAFKGCDQVIVTENGIHYVDDWVIDCDNSITMAELKADTKGIADYTFEECSKLTSIIIPESVTSIGHSAFSDCSSLTSVTIPNSVTFIGDELFYACKSLTSITVDENNTKYKSIDGNLYTKNGKILIQYAISKRLREFLIPISVTKIANNAFAFGSNLTSVIIPDGVTSIGCSAFSDCISLTSITIPDSVTSIGHSVFSGCSSLTNVTIGDSVTSIGEYAFYDCSSLTSVTMGENVTSIGEYAFFNCRSLMSITIPASVTEISGYSFAMGAAFSNCYKLVEVVNKSSLEITAGGSNYGCVGYYAKQVITDEQDSKLIYQDDFIFYNNNGYYYLMGYTGHETNLVLPDDIYGNNYGIYQSAFFNCRNLISVIIPNGVVGIGEGAFSNCYKLVEVVNKSSLEITEGDSGNGNVGYFAKQVITDEVDSKLICQDDFIFYNDKGDYYLIDYVGNATDLVLPDRIYGNSYAIYQMAFQLNSSLMSITIPDSVTSIGYRAFYNCSSLTSVTIGNGVTSIGAVAFYGCSGLTSVYYEGTENEWSNILIGSSNSYLTSAMIYYYSESQPTESGNYWHYDADGKTPVIW